MPQSPEIKLPSGYAPAFALAFTDSNGDLAFVAADQPLPTAASVTIEPVAEPTPPQPLSGTSATSAIVGPFAPLTGRPIVLALTGTWTGTVSLLRSVDGGATKVSLTAGGLPWGVYTANVCEAAWEESEAAAEFYLDIAPESGTVEYRVSQ